MKFRVNDMNIRIFFLMTAMTSSSVMFGCCGGSTSDVVSRGATPNSEPEQVISVRNPLLPPSEQERSPLSSIEPSLRSSVKTSPNQSSMRLVSASGSRNDLPNVAGSNTGLGSFAARNQVSFDLPHVVTSEESPVAGQDQQFPTVPVVCAQETLPLTPHDQALSACERVLRVMFVSVFVGGESVVPGVHRICGVTPFDDEEARRIARTVFCKIINDQTIIELVKWTPPTMGC